MRFVSPKALFGAWVIQSIVVFIWILLIPKEAENGIFLGFTPARLFLLGGTLALFFLSVVLFFYDRFPAFSWLIDAQRLERVQDVGFVLSFLAIFIAPVSIVVLHSLPDGPEYAAYAERLTPLAVWVSLAGVEFIVFTMFLRYQQGIRLIGKLDGHLIRMLAWVFAALSGIFWFVANTKIGLTQDKNMGAPAIPLLEWQVILIFLLLTVIAFTPWRYFERWERWAALLIYVLTVTLWLSQPINPAYTATPPRAPNFEIYPFSDPQIYSQYAQAALVGNGFLYPDVPSRAFYVAFLTWAHWLGIQDYNLVVILQTLLLAWLPVSLYLIGRELGGRAVGLGLAAMPIFRDINSNIAVPFSSNVTYSKLFLSELPLALLLGFCTWVVIRWLKYDQRSVALPIWAGSLLGAASLVRTQSVALVVVIAFISLLVMQEKKRWLIGMSILGISLAFTLTPWLARNYVATGGLVVDNPISQVMTMARRWSGSWGNESIPRIAGETDAQYSSRMTGLALDAFRRDPQYILRTASNHFVNSEIASLMVLPIRSEVRSLSEIVLPRFAFWSTTITQRQMPLFLFYLMLFGVGVAASARRLGWLGMLPLSMGIFYNAWTALFFSSGERFVVPLDWTIYFYQVFGLVTLGVLFLGFTKSGYENASAWISDLTQNQSAFSIPDTGSRMQVWIAIGAMFFFAIFTPATESIFPQRFTPDLASTLEDQARSVPKAGETVIYGRAVYPRYYFSGEGEPDSAKLGYAESEEPRLVFFVVGSSNGLVVFYLEDPPDFFPHASDVYLVGKWSEAGYFSPREAFVVHGGQSAKYRLP